MGSYDDVETTKRGEIKEDKGTIFNIFVDIYKTPFVQPFSRRVVFLSAEGIDNTRLPDALSLIRGHVSSAVVVVRV